MHLSIYLSILLSHVCSNVDGSEDVPLHRAMKKDRRGVASRLKPLNSRRPRRTSPRWRKVRHWATV